MLSVLSKPRKGTRAQRTYRGPNRARVQVEELESRNLLAVLTPLQVRTAYGFNQATFNNQTIAADGKGQTIAIVDAYDAPNIFSDLDQFDQAYSVSGGQNLYQQYGAAGSFLTKATPGGLPAADSGWEGEISLDVEWAHAIAPGANILLVEAVTNNLTDLLNAVDYARSQPGVVAVSMSWGSSEFKGETSLDSHFMTPTGHVGGNNGQGGANLPGGITFVASSGDTHATDWPAVSPNVLAVGATNVTLTTSSTYKSEAAWSSSGGGYSLYESKPGYQSGLVSGTKRGSPDVAYNGGSSSPVYIYLNGSLYSAWGTSAGAPQWAALVAIADEGRALAGQGALDGASQTLPAIYKMPSNDLHDITGRPAGPGWDTYTGRGTPVANLVITQLVGVTANGSLTVKGSSSTSGTTSSAVKMTPRIAGIVSIGSSVPGIISSTTATGTQLQPGGSATTAVPVEFVRILQSVSAPAPLPTFTITNVKALTDTSAPPTLQSLSTVPVLSPRVPNFRDNGGGMDGLLDTPAADPAPAAAQPATLDQPAKLADPRLGDALLEAFDAYFGADYATDQAIQPAAAAVASSEDISVSINPLLLAACALVFGGGALVEESRAHTPRSLKQ